MSRALADSQVCADGSSFAVHSELVRGEPRFYWVEYRPAAGVDRSRPVDADTGSHDKRSAQRWARRLADAHDDDLKKAEEES